MYPAAGDLVKSIPTPRALTDAAPLDPIDARAARELLLDAYAALVQSVRHEAAQRGEPAPAEARLLAQEAMRRLMGPAFDRPTRADLLVMKKRLDARLSFDVAPAEQRELLDSTCLQVVDRTR
jgi:hypothetical protein